MVSSFREKSRFKVRSEDGREFTVVETVPLIDVTSQSSSGKECMEGLPRLTTLEGHTVTRKGPDEFEIVELGLRVRKI